MCFLAIKAIQDLFESSEEVHLFQCVTQRKETAHGYNFLGTCFLWFGQFGDCITEGFSSHFNGFISYQIAMLVHMNMSSHL